MAGPTLAPAADLVSWLQPPLNGTNGIDINLTIPSSAGLYCSELPGNPRFGHQSFDDFGRGLHPSTSHLDLSRFFHKIHPKYPLIPPDTP